MSLIKEIEMIFHSNRIFAQILHQMNLTPQDVKLLYGSLLFRMEHGSGAETPEKEAHPTVPPEFLKSGHPIDWKLKPDSQLALIIRKSEFGNKELTGLLKQCMVQSGVSLKKIGFGVFNDDVNEFNLMDMPTSAGILFSAFPEQASQPVEWNDKHVFGADPLKSLSDEAKRMELILMLKQCQEWMN